MRLAYLVAFYTLLFTGCAWFRSGTTSSGDPAKPATQAPSPKARPNSQGLIVTPAGTTVGKVVSRNGPDRYAVVSFPVGQVPAPGRHLNIYRGGLKTGEAKVTGPQRDNITIADLLKGDAQIGDEARVE